MFDIGPSELLLIVIVAVLVIGPKDLPLALRTAGRWIGKVRRVSGHFRAGVDAMIREAEMDEMEKKWREQNERIMREHPADAPAEMEPTGALPTRAPPAPIPPPAPAEAPAAPSNPAASAEARAEPSLAPETKPQQNPPSLSKPDQPLP
ncbi:twin-arginine translocase subunit TatB [Altererythrobacter xixiisoli]|uniref:Sec-independent protein translocase protein TatB n=1 Tax=Croceibacterium xixiisoli TaxID=1476466 RepID=A0A6I4TSR2_9SPHN|nr:Sec-independent protein translocase protein TatB [Croceibacterium xixiisoli]MXO98161.1 twin-arginine translocase subunit TatB [Croceibacterium xixiisoli]